MPNDWVYALHVQTFLCTKQSAQSEGKVRPWQFSLGFRVVSMRKPWLHVGLCLKVCARMILFFFFSQCTTYRHVFENAGLQRSKMAASLFGRPFVCVLTQFWTWSSKIAVTAGLRKNKTISPTLTFDKVCYRSQYPIIKRSLYLLLPNR